MTQIEQRTNTKLWVLLAAGSLAVMPGAVILPVLGDIKAQFQLDEFLAGRLASAHYSMVALFSPILGILASRIGWVRVLIGSLLLFALFGIAGTWTNSFSPMLMTRLLLGAATGGIAAASLGILAQIHQQEEERSQAIALASSTISLANIAYPLLAGLLGAGNWRSAFYLYGLSIPVALAAMFNLSDRPKRSDTATALLNSVELSKILAMLGNLRVLRFMLTLLLTSATAYATVTNLSIYLKSAPISASTPVIGTILASQAIGSAIISAFGLKYLTRRFGVVPTIGIGFGFITIALTAMPNLVQPALLLPVAILFGVGLGIVIPSHYGALANITPPNLQSIVLAVGTGVTFLGQFLSPDIFGTILRSEAPITTFYAGALLALGMGLLLLISSRNLQRVGEG
jgi:predicted MFS family arabinose efflux permease